MKRHIPVIAVAMVTVAAQAATPTAPQTAQQVAQHAADPRLREQVYDPRTVVTLPVRRGVVTLIVLDADESILEVASGLGADCARPESVWCIAAQPGGRTLFVKPKGGADQPNTLAVVTDRRSHSFRLVVLADDDQVQPVYRLLVKAAGTPARTVAAATPATAGELVPDPIEPSAAVVRRRLRATPEVVNSAYSLAEGAVPGDFVPSLVFDDGRFTYLRLAANREVPAVFHVLSDGSETLVNTRMEGDLLVVDRVSRQLVLRAGPSVVGIWNDAFDADGRPPLGGTTVPGVVRTTKTSPDTSRAQP